MKNSFTQREIATAINNAVVFAKAPARTGTITAARLARLYEYATALFLPLTNEIDEEFLSPEEAVFICLAGALMFQTRLMGTRMPAEELTTTLVRKKDKRNG